MEQAVLDRKIDLINQYMQKEYGRMLRGGEGVMPYANIVPGSKAYETSLWDWDSWFTDVALLQLFRFNGIDADISEYEKGCVLNFLVNAQENGRLPIFIIPERVFPSVKNQNSNTHKPVIAQHIELIAEEGGQGYDWIAPYFDKLENFSSYYEKNCLHACGLYFWLDDSASGVDNDPCNFYRPDKSCGSILLNSLMYRELLSMEQICLHLGFAEKAKRYAERASALKDTINRLCWDERNGFYYSVDLNLRPVDPNAKRHSGAPRNWDSLIQKIDVWSGLLPMWAGIASPERAQRILRENLQDTRTFAGKYGIRSLSKLEQMYQVIPSGNPSCWLGPVWGLSNYLAFEGMLRYGYEEEAREMAEKTVDLLGSDIEACGDMHEYYDPDTGAPIFNQGFQSWNFLVINMISWLRNGTYISVANEYSYH